MVKDSDKVSSDEFTESGIYFFVSDFCSICNMSLDGSFVFENWREISAQVLR